MNSIILSSQYDPCLPYVFIETMDDLFKNILDRERTRQSADSLITNFTIEMIKHLIKKETLSLNLFRPVTDRWIIFHTLNVSYLVCNMLIMNSFPYTFTVQGVKSAIMHDIAHILLKSSSIEDDRDEVRDNWRLHIALGYRLCTRFGLSREVCDSVLYHHERFDGMGLANLKGKRIPFYSRLINLADKVEQAIFHNEEHPESFPNSLMKMKGNVLDPDLVEDFIHTFGPFPPGTRFQWKGETYVFQGTNIKNRELLFVNNSGKAYYVPLDDFLKNW